MSQPTPKVSSADVERIVRRDFGSDSRRALDILSEYGKEDWHRETERVRLAALKLAAGDLRRLRSEIETASQDYRDVLASAEYPAYSRYVHPSAGLPETDRQIIIDADWRQYCEWLEREA